MLTITLTNTEYIYSLWILFVCFFFICLFVCCFSFLDELLRGIQYNDMLRPLKQLSSELVKRKTKTGMIARHHGIYRELLFLSFVAIGRENIDQSKPSLTVPPRTFLTFVLPVYSRI
jgi:hypothetical protein